jgi:hypothetical protein
MADSLVTAAMRELIGRPFGEARSYPVDRNDIRRWAIAVHYPQLPPAHYLDDESAQKVFGHGMVAPEDFNPFAWASAEPGLKEAPAEFDPDFIEHQFGVEGPGSITNLNSGLETEYGVRIKPGDVISKVSWVKEYVEKESSRMGPMLLTYIVTEFTNQDEEMVRRTTQLGIRYRGRDS